jgi:hypothetical protein
MPYAIFENDEKLTRLFASEQEAWDAAERAGLVEVAHDGRKKLDDHLEIRFCPGEPQEEDTDTDAGADFMIS